MKKVTQFIDFPQEFHPERLFVLEHLGQDPLGRKVLDVGCGTHKTVPWAVGVDVRPVTDITAEADDLPFEAGSVDVVISRHSLEHVLDQAGAISEWSRVLRAGGLIILVLPDHGLIDTIDPFLSAGQHVHAYSQKSLASFLALFPQLRIIASREVIHEWSFGAVICKLIGKL